MEKRTVKAICYAIAAAVFYALNVPCSKFLLRFVAPTYMAAFLYLGAGIGVGMMYFFHQLHRKNEERFENLSKKDWPYAVGMVLLDIIAPILLMTGVKLGTSANASLLGNFEIVATTVIALLLFKEKVSGKLWTAIWLITLSSIILSFGSKDSFSFSVGSLFILGATACWGLENNCTRSISDKNTYQIVTIKGFGSGIGALFMAFILGEKLPEIKYIPPVLLLGFVAYGLSIFTYIRAQKTLGAAKTSAYYAVAPFIGAFLSFVLLKESLTCAYIVALVVMIAGTMLVVSENLHNSKKNSDAQST